MRLAFAMTGSIALVTVCWPALAQQGRPLVFETASVKPAKAPNGVIVSGGKVMVTRGGGAQIPRNIGGPGSSDPGRIHYPLIDMKDLLRRAWGDSYFEITSPGWLDMQLVAIDATMPPDTTKEQFSEMLRNLIIDRFKLTFHIETKEISGYSLVVAKNGPKMKESPDQNGSAPGEPAPPTSRDADGFPILPPRTGAWCVSFRNPGDIHRLTCQQQAMHDLAGHLAEPNSTVTDATGLTAKYDFTLTYSGGDSGGLPDAAAPLPDIFSAVQSQLGLRLEPKKVTVRLMVVDHIEKTPTRN